MRRHVWGPGAALLAASRLVAVAAFAADDGGDALCLLQRDVVQPTEEAFPPSPFAWRSPSWRPPPRGAPAPPAYEVRAKSLQVGARSLRGRHAEDGLAAQRRQLAGYVRESQALLQEIDEWKALAASARARKDRLQSRVAQLAGAPGSGGRGGAAAGKGGKETEMRMQGHISRGSTAEAEHLAGDARMVQDAVRRVSQENSKLEEQVTRMRGATSRMSAQNEALRANVSKLAAERARLQQQMDSLKSAMRSELNVTDASIAEISMKSYDSKQLMHHMRSCEEELKELETYIQEQMPTPGRPEMSQKSTSAAEIEGADTAEDSRTHRADEDFTALTRRNKQLHAQLADIKAFLHEQGLHGVDPAE